MGINGYFGDNFNDDEIEKLEQWEKKNNCCGIEEAGAEIIKAYWKMTEKKKSNKYSLDFEAAWIERPRRQTTEDKKKAYRAWNARLREGYEPQEMIDGMMRYCKYIKHTGNEGGPFVLMTATFYGPADPPYFKQEWPCVTVDRAPRTDQEWQRWGQQKGIDAKMGELMPEYVRRLQAAYRGEGRL